MAVRLWDRLAVRLTAAFVLAALVGVALVAVFAYRSTSSEFGEFLGHMRMMQQMMGAGVEEARRDFLDGLGRTLWIAGVSGLAVAILLGLVFTRHIVAPLGRVAAAARKVARGHLEGEVDVRGTGELVELGQSFNVMAESLRRDRDLRQSMMADIAHELRTPLSVLRGNTEAMLDGVLPADRPNLESIHQETMLLARLVEDLRTLSLAEAGELRFQPGSTDLRALCRQVMDSLEAQFQAKDIALTLEGSGAVMVRADPDRTGQVLRNMLGNALHYTPRGGSVTVALAGDRDGAVVSVSDSGVGIAEDDLAGVFDRFYRVDRSRARSTGGSGLGLAIARQLVEAQGGRVWAESVLGRGSTFYFSLPRT